MDDQGAGYQVVRVTIKGSFTLLQMQSLDRYSSAHRQSETGKTTLGEILSGIAGLMTGMFNGTGKEGHAPAGCRLSYHTMTVKERGRAGMATLKGPFRPRDLPERT